MERKTTPGRTYAIYSTTGCTVTNGSETVTVPAATTTYVTAYRGDIEISDDAAECVEVFKSAPIGLLGGGGSGGGSGEPVGDYLTYDKNGNITGGKLDNLTTCNLLKTESNASIKAMTEWHIDMPKLTYGHSMFTSSNLTSFEGNLNSVGVTNSMFNGTKIQRWTVAMPNATNHFRFLAANPYLVEFAVQLGPKVSSCMQMFSESKNLEIFASDIPASVSHGDGMFNMCILNKESALRVLNTLPTKAALLTIGINADLKTDSDILAAIDAATAKGWTVTVQWNAKST